MHNDEILKLIKREVVPATGCTEPMCVALCVAHACEVLGGEPDSIQVSLSSNVLKNAMGVGIPGTGMVGLPIAVALGAIIGKTSYNLEVLKECTTSAVEKGKQYIADGRISISLDKNACDNLYVDVICKMDGRMSEAIIAHEHTNLVYLYFDGKVLLDNRSSLKPSAYSDNESNHLTLRQVYDFAMNSPLEQLEFINKAKELNESAAQEALRGNYGHELGKTLSRPLGKGIMGESIFSHILSVTSSACDARMAGAMIPVMSNSGSGNQGIAATLPVVVFAKENHNTEEELTRALILSHLTAIYIKQSLGRLSALCGCVVASTGSSCGITYLMGGGYDQIVYSVKNMIANLAGMVCDGAKPSCALKVSSGVSTAVLSAMLAIQNKYVSSVEGLIEDDVDRCIRNLTLVGAKGMQETDRMVLDIMTNKH
ncbi:MAG: serine dehydratase subunit alpha family protein [Bacteroidaceae bacterium]|nr:serine dehydratase subunit alpha family protein [Bacteroidaceae bacterium]